MPDALSQPYKDRQGGLVFGRAILYFNRPRSAGARTDDRGGAADATGRSAKSGAPEHDSGSGRLRGRATPTLVALGAVLRGIYGGAQVR